MYSKTPWAYQMLPLSMHGTRVKCEAGHKNMRDRLSKPPRRYAPLSIMPDQCRPRVRGKRSGRHTLERLTPSRICLEPNRLSDHLFDWGPRPTYGMVSRRYCCLDWRLWGRNALLRRHWDLGGTKNRFGGARAGSTIALDTICLEKTWYSWNSNSLPQEQHCLISGLECAPGQG